MSSTRRQRFIRSLVLATLATLTGLIMADPSLADVAVIGVPHPGFLQIGHGLRAQCLNPDGSRDILDALLAPILERVGQLVSDLVSHHSRDADAPRLS